MCMCVCAHAHCAPCLIVLLLLLPVPYRLELHQSARGNLLFSVLSPLKGENPGFSMLNEKPRSLLIRRDKGQFQNSKIGPLRALFKEFHRYSPTTGRDKEGGWGEGRGIHRRFASLHLLTSPA